MSYFQLTLVWNRVPAGNGKGSINSPMCYALRFSRKNKQTEYILAFALCFLVSIATLWLSSNTKCLLSQQEIDQEETSFGMQLCKNTSVKNKWECLFFSLFECTWKYLAAEWHIEADLNLFDHSLLPKWVILCLNTEHARIMLRQRKHYVKACHRSDKQSATANIQCKTICCTASIS